MNFGSEGGKCGMFKLASCVPFMLLWVGRSTWMPLLVDAMLVTGEYCWVAHSVVKKCTPDTSRRTTVEGEVRSGALIPFFGARAGFTGMVKLLGYTMGPTVTNWDSVDKGLSKRCWCWGVASVSWGWGVARAVGGRSDGTLIEDFLCDWFNVVKDDGGVCRGWRCGCIS